MTPDLTSNQTIAIGTTIAVATLVFFITTLSHLGRANSKLPPMKGSTSTTLKQ